VDLLTDGWDVNALKGENMEEEKHTQGLPWKRHYTFWSFEEADTKRKELLESNAALEVKVKKYNLAKGIQFVVKTRKLQKIKEVEK
jgi:hypothetical protein